MGASKRICFACEKPIGRRDKWHIVGCYIQHDDCQNPTMKPLIKPSVPSAQELLEPRDAFQENSE